ncbi:hypothetical protein M427DRAFT_67128 [Gonapodya prolifera JEL478]|uniref:Thioesterase/thiol ester dehydrase-isomerase n=1 Tax=Gonapodya prolifera (strain JEL478) TaxID=1344416 RepID=A0A139ARW1_GONPJ|nr:hypothetical protein M427DRAFT_67128 [Gonapodya prolifera JEL478]|eukprot:KXS19486.1 hypothetical protein M427DRAFT_67128 [Gonapodya prolifera JEL478]
MPDQSSLLARLSSFLPQTPIGVLKPLAALLLAANFRNLPLVWHLYTARVTVAGAIWRRARDTTYQTLDKDARGEAIAQDFFAPRVLKWRVTPGDCDANMHLNNATYYIFANFSRDDLLCRSGIGYFNADPRSQGRLILGGTELAFLKEIPLGRLFVVKSRWVTFNEKWFIVETRFEDPSGSILYTIGHAKMIVKRGGRTVSPDQALKDMGVPDRYWKRPVPSCCQAIMESNKTPEFHRDIDAFVSRL